MQTPKDMCDRLPAISDRPPLPPQEPGSVRYSGRGPSRRDLSHSEGKPTKKGRTQPDGFGDIESQLQRRSRRNPLHDPPEILDPLVGDVEPTGRLCETCHTLCEWWIYNPFSKNGIQGWVKQAGSCHCSREAERRREAELFKFERGAWDTGLDQADLNEKFGVRTRKPQTFERFSIAAQPKMKAMRQRCEAFAEALGALPFPEQGLALIGPVSSGRKHLLQAVSHQARRLEVTVLCLAVPRALETPGEAWPLLGRVTLLCLTDLLLHPLLPSELRKLDGLLETREAGRLPTCFSLPQAPGALLARYPSQRDAVAAVLARVERMAELVSAPPGTAPFTPRMEAALR